MDDDPLALVPLQIIPTSDDDERELEAAREWSGPYWRHALERREWVRRESSSLARLMAKATATALRDRTRSTVELPETEIKAVTEARLAPRPVSLTPPPRILNEERSASRDLSLTPPPPLPITQERRGEPRPRSPTHAQLLAFQNARTFRPRTALQLQPYTRERLAYQAVVRRGGGRGLVKELDVVPGTGEGEADSEDEAYEQPPEMETIQEPPEPEPEEPPTTPTTEDYSQFARLHPEAATPSPSDRVLQALARQRRRTAAVEAERAAKARRAEVAFARRLDREMRERARAVAEEEKKRRRAEREEGRKRRERDREQREPVDVGLLLRGLDPGSSEDEQENAVQEQEDEEEPRRRKRIRRREDETIHVDPAPSVVDEFTVISSGDSSSGGEGEESTPGRMLPREKARALNRMLPAVMVKRLHQAPQVNRSKEKRRQPVEGAGIAKVRAPARVVMVDAEPYGNDEMGIFDDFDMDHNPRPLSPPQLDFAAPLSPPPTSGPPTIPTSPSTVASCSDDDGATSVRLLHAGAFSRLLNGDPRAARPPAPRERGGNGLLRAARSARGVVRRSKKPAKTHGESRAREQPRLAFPRQAALTGTRTRTKARARARPRMLDDETIFQMSDDEPQPPPQSMDQSPRRTSPAPRAVQRGPRQRISAHPPVTPRVRPPVAARTAATPKYKASLWTELQDFQVDFDVKPLPSGVSFDAETWLGGGGLVRFLTGETRVQPLALFGMSLSEDMQYTELLQLLPALLDGVYDQIMMRSNDRTPIEPAYMSVFDFLDGYIVAHIAHPASADAARLIENLLERLTAVRSVRTKCRDDRHHLFLLDASFALFKLLFRISVYWPDAHASPTLHSSLLAAAQDTVERLLAHGFDKTMKSLKAIMAFTADRPILTDFTAECWVTLIHSLRDLDARRLGEDKSFSKVMETVTQRLYVENQAGPYASERIWYITFGLAALHQFGRDGVTLAELEDHPQWSLVRKALSLISFPDVSEVDEYEKRHQLVSRDKYIKIMVIRCLQLTCTWQWRCNHDSFAIASRDLGILFKKRQLRNLPNEPSSDFPAFIREYDLKRSSEVDIEESTYNLYLQLVCVSASDLIASATDMAQAEQAVNDVRKLMLSIIAFSPVKPAANGIFHGRQLGALVNRFSALVVVVLFVPDLLKYCLGAAKNWVSFDCGDIEVQRILLRGYMYMGIAARHHESSVAGVVDRLAEIFESVHAKKKSFAAHEGDKIKAQERLLILLVSCYRQIIERHCFDREMQEVPAYPEPCLLHSSAHSFHIPTTQADSSHRLDESSELHRSHYGSPCRTRSHRDHTIFP